MIKRFEQMDWNEDWEEEDPNKGPFDDILIYGKDGPEFKCGDRVKYIDYDELLKDQIGTIVDYNVGTYIVCFDKNIGGWGDKKWNIKKGRGKVVLRYDLKKI